MDSTSNANEQHRLCERIQETEVEMKNNHSKAYEELKHTHSLTNVVLHPFTNYTLLPQPKREKTLSVLTKLLIHWERKIPEQEKKRYENKSDRATS